MTVWLVGWAVGTLVVLGGLGALVRGEEPESLTLRGDELAHEPGPSRVTRGQPAEPGSPLAKPRPRTVPRQQVAAGLRLDRAGERQRLTVECAAERFEIGPALREPEREWLYGVLAAWAGGPDERIFSPEVRIAAK
jgi:hypothetical protein